MEKVLKKIIADLETEIFKATDNMLQVKCLEKAIEIVKRSADSYNNGWIPAGSMYQQPNLPPFGTNLDECPEYIVSINCAEEATVLQVDYDGAWIDREGNFYHVLAWQPLPKAYSKKQEIEWKDYYIQRFARNT